MLGLGEAGRWDEGRASADAHGVRVFVRFTHSQPRTCLTPMPEPPPLALPYPSPPLQMYLQLTRSPLAQVESHPRRAHQGPPRLAPRQVLHFRRPHLVPLQHWRRQDSRLGRRAPAIRAPVRHRARLAKEGGPGLGCE